MIFVTRRSFAILKVDRHISDRFLPLFSKTDAESKSIVNGNLQRTLWRTYIFSVLSLFPIVFFCCCCCCFQLLSQQPKSFGDKLSVYFSDTWNVVDTFSLLAFVVAVFLRFFDSTFEAARIILSLNIIVFIVRSLQILSVNRQLGPKLVMIRKMVRIRGQNEFYVNVKCLVKLCLRTN